MCYLSERKGRICFAYPRGKYDVDRDFYPLRPSDFRSDPVADVLAKEAF